MSHDIEIWNKCQLDVFCFLFFFSRSIWYTLCKKKHQMCTLHYLVMLYTFYRLMMVSSLALEGVSFEATQKPELCSSIKYTICPIKLCTLDVPYATCNAMQTIIPRGPQTIEPKKTNKHQAVVMRLVEISKPPRVSWHNFRVTQTHLFVLQI